MDGQPRKDNDEQTRARRPSKRPKKMGKQRRALEKEGTQMTIFPEPHPGRRRAGPPDEEARINPLRGGGAEAPGFLLRVDERRGIGKLLQTWYFLGMAGPVANHISLQK